MQKPATLIAFMNESKRADGSLPALNPGSFQ